MRTIRIFRTRRGGGLLLLLISAIIMMTTCYVIIHANNNHNANADELTTDNAYISSLNMVKFTTGTAPFDNDDTAGNDSSETNDIVRTYDDVTATYKYSVTTDDNSQYTSGRIGIRIELPYSQRVIDFNQDKMLWIDKTTGYEPKITTENINGVQTRVLTAYRMITGNGHSTVIPGSGNIDIVYHVNGAANGQKITPEISAWVVPNDKHSRIITADSKTFAVSAKPSYNIFSISSNVNVSRYDFSQFNNKAYDSYYNSDLGVRTGNIQKYNIGIEAKWPTAEERANKGIKGLETPSGNLTFTITAESNIRDSSNKTIQMSNDDKAQIQPYLWNVSNHDTIRRRNSKISVAWNNRISENVHVPFEGLTVNEQRNSDNTTYTVNVNTDRLANNNYPEKGVSLSCDYFTDKKDGQCSNSGKIIIAEMGYVNIDVFNPIDYNDKTLITSKYPNAASVYTIANITDFHAISKSGIKINNETVNTDNSMRMSMRTQNSYLSSYRNYTNFTCINYYQAQMGSDCANWNSNGNYLRSTDIGLHDDNIRIILFNRILDNYQGNDEIIALKMFKFNPDYFDFDFNNPQVSINSKYLKTYYAVKPDGSKWSSNQELIKTHVKDLKYYDSYDEASSHGTVIAVLFQQTAKAHSSIFIDGKVKTTAPLGTYGLIGSETIEWSKYYLNDNGYNDDGKLDPYDETQNTAWRDYMSTIDWLNGYINDTGLKPLMVVNMNSYKEPSYDENGKLLNGGNNAGGDAMLIVNEKNTVTRSTAQTINGNTNKTLYDLDNSERIIDYKINFTTVSSENNRHNANVYITDTIPAGLNYINNSGYLDGSYKQNLPLQGIISGGSKINPKITKNDDGSTTLLFTVPNVYTDGSQHVINYSLKIGNENDPDNDVTNNSAFLTQSVIESTGNHAEKYKEGKTLSEFTVRINKNGTSSLSIMSMKPYVDISTDFTYDVSITNRAGVLNNPFMVIKLPANDTSDSENVNYHGSIKLTGFKSKQKLSSDAAFYYTADSKYGNMAVNKITRTDITDNWVKLAYDNDTGVISLPSGGVKPLMLAYVDSSINDGQSNGFTVTVKPTDNESGDVYNTVISDGGALTSSIVSVVSRTISGTAWFDANGNGIRNTDDKLLDKVKVSITDKNGKTLKDLTGKDLTTTTDGNGYYSFSNIPSGSDYQVRFINSNDNLNAMTATLKAAGSDATVQNQADSVMRTDDKTKLDYTVIMLPVLPSADDMTSSSFILDNQNSGLTGELPYVDGVLNFKVTEKLTNRNLVDSDAFKVSILPSNASSPAGVIQNELLFDKANMSRTAGINVDNLKPGSYAYKVSNVDTHISGVKYDENWFTIRITIRNDYDNFKKTADVSMVKYDGSDAVNELSFMNVYMGNADMPMTGMRGILIVLIGLCLIACVHVVKHIILVKYEK